MNQHQTYLKIGLIRAGALLAVLYICGCSSPPLVTRPVHTEPTWFVRLDTYQEPEQSRVPQYDHPAEWNETELVTILSRLLVQPEGGLLDRKRPAVAVFSAEEIARLAPILRTAFQQARASEWVSFMFSYPTGTNLEVTSGAFFIANRRLHVVVANAREIVNQFETDIGLVRSNPMRSISGVHGHLTFDPARFIVETGANWSGGSNNSASELVLDYREIHTVAPPLIAPTANSSNNIGTNPASPQGPATGLAALNARAAAENDLIRENRELTTQVRRLEAQVENLSQRLKEQESVLLQLRKDVDAVRSTNTRKDARPSP
jgi:hypothetical protein